MSQKALIFLLLLVSFFEVRCSHIIGGSIHYEDLGDGNYAITLTLYRDCSSNTEYDDPASIGCFNASGDLVYNLEIDIADAIITSVPAESNSACYMAPLGLCVEEAIYSGIAPLPPIAGGYTLTYQRCCRNFSIVNVPTGTDVGITLTTNIPGPDVVTDNNNPEFLTHPPLVICLGAPFVFDHSATDDDGDQLVYEFCAPLNTNVNGNYINPPGAPPYSGLAYFAGYSPAYPIDANPAFIINESTGLITGTPTSLGQYVVGVCISEYRNGILINQTNRDFQLNVTTCDPTDSPVIADQENICSGLLVSFLNDSPQDLTYFWDFGVASTNADTSNAFEPSYTYPAPGEYEIMLVLNPGLSCADTAYSTYVSSPSIDPVIAGYNTTCVDGQTVFSFSGECGLTGLANYVWDFGADANASNVNLQNPTGIVFGNGNSSETVTLSVSQSGCTESTSIIVVIPPAVMAAIEEQNTFCDGFGYQFNNLSVNATEYLWDFGTGSAQGLSNDVNPYFTFANTGLYLVRLIASNASVCPDTATTLMLIYGLLQPSFEVSGPQCQSDNEFQFVAEGASTNEAVYQWEFGNSAQPSSASLQTTPGVHFMEAGFQEISLTILENDCVETYVDSVLVIPDPVFIALSDTMQTCADGNALFHGASIAENTVFYLWDFGDGTTSSQQSPSHMYDVPGIYDVGVEMWTQDGCIRSSSVFFENVIQVIVPPVAGFELSDQLMNLPGTEVMINSTTANDYDCSYTISDGGFSEECDFSYVFNESGTFTVTQVVTDNWGCQATITGEVIVQGSVFYAPNTFTPDDDGLNDVWIPQMTGFSDYELKIYDRWGDMIFMTEDMEQPWTGSVRGGDYYAQNDIYIYKVAVKDLMGLPKEFTGHIVLIR